MQDNFQIARLAGLIADPSRAIMLVSLMDGRAYTSGELARTAGLTPQTASGHLVRLADEGLLSVVKQGRHRYYRLASDEVAQALEALQRLTQLDAPARPRPKVPASLRFARSCYDHIAGSLGVTLYQGFIERGFITEQPGGAVVLQPAGQSYLHELGIGEGITLADLPPLRPCLDWSERRFHLAGPLAHALLERYLALGYLQRVDSSRQLKVTPSGWQHFQQLEIALDETAA
ncbi:ArsR/SmtB family transcription factor [Marinobacterium arenosum]|uniref:ArsR/SmtB family transcription factor n=1 Tax=Marinobacterium arenosum TaxID=2862496 RepID=UPI001C9528D7|nr:helix-turn-helix transcriptional regulator [Marinobacterium arenosum]MBY4675215.1 ArsR family transcriptional regulator [Marinobacterium arenosum]